MNGRIIHSVTIGSTYERVIARSERSERRGNLPRFPSSYWRNLSRLLRFARNDAGATCLAARAITFVVMYRMLSAKLPTMPWALAFLFVAVSSPAFAHHILGIPHYSYDENYPQTPVLTYHAELGPLEMKLTGYPGNPKPGEACSLHVYLRRLDGGAPFDAPVTLSIMRDRFLGDDPVVYGPITAQLEESLYKFYPRFEEEANYIVRVEYEVEGVPWIIDLPMVVGEPGSPWAVVGSVAAALAAFLVVVRAARIKMKRQAKTPVKTAVNETQKSPA